MEKVTLVPMLRVQRGLYDLPRGAERFRRYLDAMTGGTDDIVLPLAVFNPMGKDHVAATLDRLLGVDAEGVAIEAVDEANRRLAGVDAGLIAVALRGRGIFVEGPITVPAAAAAAGEQEAPEPPVTYSA